MKRNYKIQVSLFSVLLIAGCQNIPTQSPAYQNQVADNESFQIKSRVKNQRVKVSPSLTPSIFPSAKIIFSPSAKPVPIPSTLPTPAPTPQPVLNSHLSDLQDLLDGDGPQNRLQAHNNVYSTNKAITWPEDGVRSNSSVCAPLVTLALKHSYGAQGLTEDAFQDMAGGSTSPYPWGYYQAFKSQPIGFDPNTQTSWQFQEVSDMANLIPGDIIAIDYIDDDNGCTKDNNPQIFSSSSSASGHAAVFESMSAPIATNIPGTGEPALSFDVVVIDSSGSYHGSQDTRFIYPQSSDPFEKDTGLGRGTMRFYSDPQTGIVIGYKWSTGSSSTCRPHQRRVAFGRLTQF